MFITCLLPAMVAGVPAESPGGQTLIEALDSTPPSQTRLVPVTNEDCAPSSQHTAAAGSLGSASRPSGTSARIVARIRSRSAAGTLAHINGVSVGPGTTALTRMPCPAYSTASARTNASIPPLLAEYADTAPAAKPTVAAGEEQRTSDPGSEAATNSRSTARLTKNAPVRLTARTSRQVPAAK